jgi:hypothetical protein
MTREINAVIKSLPKSVQRHISVRVDKLIREEKAHEKNKPLEAKRRER